MNLQDLKILHLTDSHVNLAILNAFASFGDANPVTGIGKRLVGYDDSVETAIDRAVLDDVDVIVLTGDNVDAGGTSNIAERIAKTQAFVTYFDGVGIPTVCCFGHWDISGIEPDADDFVQLYDDDDGFGTLMPTPVSTWTADIPSIVAGTPHAYTYELNNYVFVSLNFTTGSANIDLTTEDGGGQTQNQWLASRLSEIDAAGQQAVIMIHAPMLPGAQWINERPPVPQPGLDDALATIDGMAKSPVIFQGHVHEDTLNVARGNSLFINGRGDVWTSVGDGDTTRHSHSVVTIRPDAVYNNGLQTNVEIVGYGYAGNKSFDKYFIG